MYEGKFENPEWEQQRCTDYNYYRTNEYAMIEDIGRRNNEDIDEEALTILLKKYYRMSLEHGLDMRFSSKDFNRNDISNEELNFMLMYNECYDALDKFLGYKNIRNIQMYPEYFIKYLELKNLFSLLRGVKGLAPVCVEDEEKYGFSYDYYGPFAKDIEEYVIDLIKQIGKPIDYKKVKSGKYVRPVVAEKTKEPLAPVTAEAEKKVEPPVEEKTSATEKAAENTNKEEAPAEPSKKRFWKDWSTGKKVLFVLINMATYCVPLILYLIIRILKKQLLKK